MGSVKKIRVVLANSGLDVHDRGAKIIAKALIDSGMEVIYLGLRSTPEEIVETAIQEDVDAIGISNLSGAHLNINSGIIELLRERNASDILLVAGGIIYEEEKLKLREKGISGLFGPGTDPDVVVEFIKENVRKNTK